MKTLAFGHSTLTAATSGISFGLFYYKFGLIAEYFLLKKPVKPVNEYIFLVIIDM